MHPSYRRARLLFVGLTIASACGSNQAEPQEAEVHDQSGGERSSDGPSDGVAISGLRGTLSQEEVKSALDPRMPKFARCVAKRSSAVEWLAGSLELSFRVAIDGSVAAVFPTRSTFGDRETERCAVDVARAIRFPAPHGGEAELSWSFEVPLDDEIREPVAWGDAEASELVTAHASEVTAQCGGGSYGITAYVDVDGKVVSAGSATSDEANADKLDCVVDAVRGWTFQSPGSYPAKLQFSIQ